MTYESVEEAEVLKSLWRPGAPLENTLFAFLDPVGRPLTRGVRSPGFFFKDAHTMAAALNDIASRYQGRGNPERLPAIATVRLAMNVAACDKSPLTIVVADSEYDRRAMEARLAPLAWSPDLIGKMSYTFASKNELSDIQGVRLSRGYLFVSPNQFGTTGSVITQLTPAAASADLVRALELAIARHQPQQMDHHDHVRLGRQLGIHWDSVIPVTDPASLRAEQGQPGRGPGRFGSAPMRPGGTY